MKEEKHTCSACRNKAVAGTKCLYHWFYNLAKSKANRDGCPEYPYKVLKILKSTWKRQKGLCGRCDEPLVPGRTARFHTTQWVWLCKFPCYRFGVSIVVPCDPDEEEHVSH